MARSLLVVFTIFVISLPIFGQTANDSIARLPNGKPDLSGVWDHPRTVDLGRATNECGSITKGCKHVPPASLSFTPLGLAKWNDKAGHVDWTARRLPWGYTRAWGTEYPVEIVQTPHRLSILRKRGFLTTCVYSQFHVRRIYRGGLVGELKAAVPMAAV